MNLVFITGRMVKDPECRYTSNNEARTSFSLAVDDGKTKDGERKTVFVNCVAWGKTGELIDQYFKKGDGITLVGKVTSRSWEQDGKKRYVQEITVTNIEFPLSRKSEPASTDTFKEISDIDPELPF